MDQGDIYDSHIKVASTFEDNTVGKNGGAVALRFENSVNNVSFALSGTYKNNAAGMSTST
jgi:hypothetical protein